MNPGLVTQSLDVGLEAPPLILDMRPWEHCRSSGHGGRAFLRDGPGQRAPSDAKGWAWFAEGAGACPGAQRRAWRTAGVRSSTQLTSTGAGWLQLGPGTRSEARTPGQWRWAQRLWAPSWTPAWMVTGLGDIEAPSSLECSRMTQSFPVSWRGQKDHGQAAVPRSLGTRPVSAGSGGAWSVVGGLGVGRRGAKVSSVFSFQPFVHCPSSASSPGPGGAPGTDSSGSPTSERQQLSTTKAGGVWLSQRERKINVPILPLEVIS